MYQSGAHLVERRDVPQDAYFRAYEAARTAEAHDIEQVKTFEAGLQHLRQTYRQQLHTMIGEGHLKRYLRLHRKRMQRVKTAQRSFRPSREGFQEQAKFYAGLIKGSTRLIHASGVDVRGVQPLARRLHAKAWELFEQTVGKAGDAPTTPTGPNQEYRPPFDGWGWSYSRSRSDEPDDPAFERYLNATTGEVGSRSTLRVSGADDADYGSVLYRTAIRQWYQVPVAAARLRVRINAVDWVENDYWGNYSDECGYCQHDCRQRVRFYAKVSSPFVSDSHYFMYAAGLGGSGFDFRDHDRRDTFPETGSWALAHVPGVPTEFVDIGGPFDAGDWVLVDVGLETYNYFWSNDVSIHQGLNQRYLIQNIGITTA